MDNLQGIGFYLISVLAMGAIYAILALGLNVQWGMAGLFNAGVAGFFAVGAYASAILTTAPSTSHLGGFQLPFALSLVAAMAISGALAWPVGKVCLRLRGDYLAIATLGVAEIFRLVLRTETWATNGPDGIAQIPRPFENLPEPWNLIGYLVLLLALVGLVYAVLEVLRRSPWGRVMAAIRDDEPAARAAGKDVQSFRLQGFVLGSMIMGLGGALTAHYLKFIDPNMIDPFLATFLVWVMLFVGGSGNNKGAILGGLLIWTVWSATELISARLPSDFAARAAYVRVFLIGLALQYFLQRHPDGILPEQRIRASKKS